MSWLDLKQSDLRGELYFAVRKVVILETCPWRKGHFQAYTNIIAKYFDLIHPPNVP